MPLTAIFGNPCQYPHMTLCVCQVNNLVMEDEAQLSTITVISHRHMIVRCCSTLKTEPVAFPFIAIYGS